MSVSDDEKALIESRRHQPEPGKDFFVFAYGSLMWRPDFPFIEIMPATLYGYHRAFCITSTHYRGTTERPGLVLGLDRGGHMHRPALSHRAERRARGRGIPAPARADHRLLRAEARDAAPAGRRQGRGPDLRRRPHALSVCRQARRTQKIAGVIRHAIGVMGSNRDYLRNTVRHLEEMGIADTSLHRILKLVEQSRLNAHGDEGVATVAPLAYLGRHHGHARASAILLCRDRAAVSAPAGAAGRDRGGRRHHRRRLYRPVSAALNLAERGYKVVLIDQARIGWGASGRNGGQINTGLRKGPVELIARYGRDRAKAMFDLAEEGRTIIRERVAKHRIRCDLKANTLFVAHRPSEVAWMRAEVAALEREFGYTKAMLRAEGRAGRAYRQRRLPCRDRGLGRRAPASAQLRAGPGAGGDRCRRHPVRAHPRLRHRRNGGRGHRLDRQGPHQGRLCGGRVRRLSRRAGAAHRRQDHADRELRDRHRAA